MIRKEEMWGEGEKSTCMMPQERAMCLFLNVLQVWAGLAEVVYEFIACCEVGEEGCLVDVMFVDGLVPHVLTRTNVWEG